MKTQEQKQVVPATGEEIAAWEGPALELLETGETSQRYCAQLIARIRQEQARVAELEDTLNDWRKLGEAVDQPPAPAEVPTHCGHAESSIATSTEGAVSCMDCEAAAPVEVPSDGA